MAETGLRILHIDDNRDDLAIFKYHLNKLEKSIQIDWAMNADEAIKILKKKSYDCVISDHEMPPGMNGLQLLKKLHELGIRMPFIYLTGQGNEQIAAEAFHLGASDYFTKDYGFAYFHRLLNSINQSINNYREITNKRKVEDALVDSEERYRRLVEMNPKAIAVHSEGKLIYLNKTALDMLGGIPAEEMIGKSIFEFIHTDQRQIAAERIKSIITKGIKGEQLEYKLVLPLNRVMDVEITGIPIPFGGKEDVLVVIDDITKRKETEQELCTYRARLEELVKERTRQLIESEEKFRALTENTYDVIMRFDRSYRHLYASPYVEKQTGIRAAEFIGKTHRDLGFPINLCRLLENAICKVFDTGELNRVEFCLPSGIWIDWLLIPEFTENGEVKTVITSARDITEKKKNEDEIRKFNIELQQRVEERTKELDGAVKGLQAEIEERKRTEKELRDSEEKYKVVVENSREAIFILQDYSIKYINDSGVQLLGYEQGELMSKNIGELVHPEERKKMIDIHSGRVRGNKKRYSFITRIINKKGETKWIDSSSVLIKWNGKPATMHFVSDITQQKLAEDTLRLSEESFRTLADQSLQAILILQDDKIAYANPEVLKYAGLALDELKNLDIKKIFSFIHPEDRKRTYTSYTNRLMGKKIPERYELRLFAEKGEMHWIDMRSKKIVYNGKPAIQVVWIDITEQKKAEEQIDNLNSLLIAIRNVIQIFNTEQDFKAIIDKTTSMLAKVRKYSEVIFAFMNEESMRIEPISRAGSEVVNLKQWSVTKDGKGSAPSCIKELINSGEIQLINVNQPSCKRCSYSSSRGRFAHILLPFKIDDDLKGILSIVFKSGQESDPEEITLLKDVVQDLGLAYRRLATEKALKASEEQYRTLFSTSPEGITISSLKDGIFKEVNNEFLQRSGYTREEVIGRSSLEIGLWSNPADRAKMINELRRKGTVRNLPLIGKGKNGEIFHILLSSVPIKYKNEPHLLNVLRDVTERDKILIDLNYSKERYRNLFNNAYDAVIVGKIDGQITEVNEVASQLLDYPAEELLSMKFQNLKTPKKINLHKVFNEITSKDKASFDLILLKKNGEPIDVKISSTLFTYGQEKLFQIFIHDTSVEKKAEKARDRLNRYIFALSKINYTLLKSNNPRNEIDFILEILGNAAEVSRSYWFENHFDVSGRFLISLRAEWCDKDEAKKTGDPRFLNVHYDEFEFGWAKFFEKGQILKGSLSKMPEEIRVLLADFNVKSLVLIPIIDNGKFRGIFGFDECKEEREWLDEEINLLRTAADSFSSALKKDKIKRELAETSSIMYAFMDSIPQCFEVKDTRGYNHLVNQATAALFNTMPENMIGKKDEDYMSSESAEILNKEIEKVIKNRKPREFLFFYNEPSEPIIFHTLYFPLISPVTGEMLIGGIKRDITEHQKNEERIKKINAELDEFVHTVSHDLRTPLNSILSYVEMSKTAESPKRDEFISKALSLGGMLQNFISQLLKLSSLGKAIGIASSFDSSLVVKEVFDLFRISHPDVSFIIEGNLPVIHADINRLREVFQNIISNALENTDPKKDHPIIKVCCKTEFKNHLFSIEDNGVGMNEATMKKLFIFGNISKQGKEDRFGFGLAIAKRIIEAHSGEIWAESTPGEGSVFYFTIPIH